MNLSSVQTGRFGTGHALGKNPHGYCALKGTGIACAVPAAVSA